MAPSPDTAPSPKATPPSGDEKNSSSESPTSSPTPSSPPPSSPPPPKDNSPPPAASPPPPKDSSPPPKASPPPPKDTSPPPTKTPSSPPPDDDPTPSPPPPPVEQAPPAPTINPVSPPPPKTAVKSPPPPRSSGSLSPPHSSSKTPPSESTNDQSTPSPSSNDSSDNTVPIVVGVVVGVGLLIFAMFIIFCCCMKKKKKKEKPIQYYADPSSRHKGNQYYDNAQNPNWYNNGQQVHPPTGMGPPGGGWAPSPPPPMMHSDETGSSYSGPHNPATPQSPMALGFNKNTFTYDELAQATNGFSQANLLGQGGFGYVHKGILPNGKVVAVKSLKSGSGQGEREFQAEVEIISRVHHRHLVSLVGYCIAGGQRMLVYEFVPNKTLEFHLHGKGHVLLDWDKRLTIAVGSAKGLAYLHEDCHPRIIHRDIKTANILLENNFEAMVADFGLAKLSADNFTHVSTRIMGTFGYLAPEYASSGKLTEKSDVFSFGVMLLEMITGRRPVDTSNTYMEDSLVDWARPLLQRALETDEFDELVDAKLENNYNPNEMKRMIACAAASIRHSAKRRPKMSQIVRALEGDVSLEDLNEGTKAAQNSNSSTGNSSEYNTRMYNEDLSKFRKMALEDSGVTSTYGLNPSSSSSDFSANSREMK